MLTILIVVMVHEYIYMHMYAVYYSMPIVPH